MSWLRKGKKQEEEVVEEEEVEEYEEVEVEEEEVEEEYEEVARDLFVFKMYVYVVLDI